MNRNVPLAKKSEILGLWPKRLDQDLRHQFGDALNPHTYFDLEKRYYTTDYNSIGVADSAQVDQFIAGFMAAVTMVVE